MYKVKFLDNGTLKRCKTKFVYSKEDLDDHKTFSLIINIVFIRPLMSLKVIKNWYFHQFNINNVFLHRELNEKPYAKLSSSYPNGRKLKVYELLKNINGLKQDSW